MSAFDVAGAVVWTPLAIWIWVDLIRGAVSEPNVGMGGIIAVLLTLASVYCIARLFGAHA